MLAPCLVFLPVLRLSSQLQDHTAAGPTSTLPVPRPGWLHYFSTAVTKHRDQSNLRAIYLWFQRVRSWQQVGTAVGAKSWQFKSWITSKSFWQTGNGMWPWKLRACPQWRTFFLNQKFKTPETGDILIQTTTVAKLMFWDAKTGPATVAQCNKAYVSVSNFSFNSSTND